MRRTFLSVALVLLCVSCSSAPSVEDILRPLDKTLPRVVSHSFEENSILSVVYSETVEVIEARVGDTPLPSGYLGSRLRFVLPTPLEPGESERINITVRKTNGNTARASFLVTGVNHNLPYILINEASIKGTTSSPDRIELLVLEGGDLQGMELRDATCSFVMPRFRVEAGDIVVVHWNVRTTKTSYSRDDGKTTWYLNANASSTLSGTNGVVVLAENPGGTVMDALVYSDYSGKDHGGFGNQRVEDEVDALKASGAWKGDPVDSSLVTSSRVLTRLPGATDGDSADDWFTSAARKSSFGENNTYSPYEE